MSPSLSYLNQNFQKDFFNTYSALDDQLHDKLKLSHDCRNLVATNKIARPIFLAALYTFLWRVSLVTYQLVLIAQLFWLPGGSSDFLFLKLIHYQKLN